MASATSIVGSGNATDCLRPIAFADEWQENRDDRQPSSNSVATPTRDPARRCNRDVYHRSKRNAGGRHDDFGRLRTYASSGIWTSRRRPPTTPITRELARRADAARGRYVQAETGELQRAAGATRADAPGGDPARSVTPPRRSDTLWTQDPTAVTWNNGQSRVENSCAPGCAPISPRLIPVALFDPDRFQLGRARRTTGRRPTSAARPTALASPSRTSSASSSTGPSGGYGPHGHFLKYPGMTSATAPTFVDDASWLVTTHLIR